MTGVDVEREGPFWYSWEARGVLRKPQTIGSICVLPTGRSSVVARGEALTRRGAQRKATRALRRWT